jgi:hypothetical protein
MGRLSRCLFTLSSTLSLCVATAMLIASRTGASEPGVNAEFSQLDRRLFGIGEHMCWPTGTSLASAWSRHAR